MDQATDKAPEGRNRPRNPGVRLDAAWFEGVGVNASAVERRAATLAARRSVKKEYQAAWLIKALTASTSPPFRATTRRSGCGASAPRRAGR